MPDSTGIVDKNQMNKTNGHHIHNYSTFDRSLSYRLYNTHRFGDYTPTYVSDGIPRDELSINSYDGIDSLSLKAPFKGSIRKIKESFMVPNMAILPLQWDRIYAQESNGDPCPQDANCIITDFPTKFKNLFSACLSSVIALSLTTTAEARDFLTGLLRTMVLGEYVYSKGSLLNVLGYKASTQLSVYSYDSRAGRLFSEDFDWWFDQLLYKLFDEISTFEVVEPVGSGTRIHRFNGFDGASASSYFEGYEQFRSMLELFRENPLCYFNSNINFGSSSLSAFAGVVTAEKASYGLLNASSFNYHLPANTEIPGAGSTNDLTALNPSTLNLTRLLSYQLIVSHFFTNSSIDFIYSAELYRQYVYYLRRQVSGYSVTQDSFSWNGMTLPYDYLSGHQLNYALQINTTNVINAVASNITSSASGNLAYRIGLSVWSAVFGFRKSLRYGDYFTASRPRPLAPVNTDVSVNNNLVSVIDITRNIQAQRFANSVMRSRSKIEEYVKSLFGSAPQPDYHNPFFLSRNEEIIFGDQVQNTGSDQFNLENSRTSNFAGNLSRHTFTFHNDDMHPCIYMQIVSYDTPRAYSRSVDRQFLHIDRFDMFNPDFQYIGDQPVYGIELGYYNSSGIPNIFSYQGRDMEYKQRFDVVSGGFATDSLPGWCFTDIRLNTFNFSSIGPDFIRSRNVDIDYLFLSLTGFSLGNYFHFICVTDNNVKAKRAMAVDPQILA